MRTMYKLLSAAGSAALLAAPLAARLSAQTVPLDVTFGYRDVRVSGNEDEYRSQINDREGLLLRNVTFATTDFGGKASFLDHFRVDGTDLGVGPAGALRMEAGKAGLYTIHFCYRHADQFSALTDFANPFYPAIIPGEHTINRVRDLYDAEVEILPGNMFTPILGYTRNTYSGPGTTTYHVGEDEFRLNSNLKDVDEEYRVGVAFHTGPVSGRIVQGWRYFRETEGLTLAPGAGSGNNLDPVLGVDVNLTNLSRSDSVKTNTPATSAYVTGQWDRVRLTGSYQRASGETNTNQNEDLAGSLVSFELSRFFAGLNETASTKSQATFWTGGGRADVILTDAVDLSVGYTKRHRWLDGFALVSDLYLNTVTFAGQDPKNLMVLLEANTGMDRTDDVVDATVSARGLGPFALKAGFAQNKQDVTVTPDLSEIVVPGNQGGEFNRRINSWNAGVDYNHAGFTFGFDYRGDRADDPIVRTDYLDRDRYRARISWDDKTDHLRISANGTRTLASNDLTGIGYDARVWEYGGDFEFFPIQEFKARFSASKYQANSTMLYRVPQDFTTANSINEENGLNLEGDLTFTFKIFLLDASYGRFQNSGSYPFTIDRWRANAEVPVAAQFSVVGEWMRDKYNDAKQDTGSLGKYAANRYGLYLRWHQ
ncbi:MAG TPA: hypothetical protein VKJ00_05750 [Thermoanaerobaculia bacterium]|nr:hypothetical protein [Thermoanaerobaculia bacterium]